MIVVLILDVTAAYVKIYQAPVVELAREQSIEHFDSVVTKIAHLSEHTGLLVLL